MKNKIKLDDLIDRNKNITDWAAPKKYNLNFHVPIKCRYCGKFFRTNKVTLYDKKYICNCPNCGGRHSVEEKTLKRWFSSKKHFKAMILIACVAFCMCSAVVFLAYYGTDTTDETSVTENISEPVKAQTEVSKLPSTLNIEGFKFTGEINDNTHQLENGYKLPPMKGSANSNYNIKALEICIYSEDGSVVSKENEVIEENVKSISFEDYEIDYVFEAKKIYKIQYIVTDESGKIKSTNYLLLKIGEEKADN